MTNQQMNDLSNKSSGAQRERVCLCRVGGSFEDLG